MLDAAGEADIFLDGLYRIVIKDQFNFVVYDVEKTGISLSMLVRPNGQSVETSLTNIDAELNKKAPTEYVNDQLELKAPKLTTYTKSEVDLALSLKASQSNTYTKAEVDTTFAAYVGGRKAFTTLALAQAAQSSLPANTAIEVTNDGANNGTYQWNGTTLTKSAYDPLVQAKAHTNALTGGATPNLFIGTKFTLNFLNNTLTGGGGIVSYGTLFIDNIPQSQSIPLEVAEEYPFGLRKVCISKTTKAFKVFNSIEDVTSDYVLLGYLFGRKWHSISSGNKPTIIGNSDTYGGNVSDLKYSFDAEIVGGVLVLNKEAKTISGQIDIFSPAYRGYIFNIAITYTGELAAIVVDTNGPVVKALKVGDVVSPSDLVIAKVSDEFIFSSSVLGAFSQVGSQKFKIYGKVGYSDITSEPTFLSEATRLTLNFSTGNLSVDQNGYIF